MIFVRRSITLSRCRIIQNSLLSTADSTSSDGQQPSHIFKRFEGHQDNAFKLFGIEQRFKINEAKLQREMRNIQTLIHPDKFVDKDAKSQEMASSLSALVNEFYAILSNPYERGKYLLSLVTKKSLTQVEEDLDNLHMDGDFLMRMMELREKIEDPELDGEELNKLSISLESELTSLVSGISQDFESNNLEAVTRKLGKLKFVVNCYRVVADRGDSFSKY